MDASTFMIATAATATPWLVALLQRQNWSTDRTTVVAVVLAVVAFVLGYTLDGKPYTLPMPGEFWLGLMASYGGQQGAYQLYKRYVPDAIETVKSIGDPS